MEISTDRNKIKELLTRSVQEIIPSKKELEELLLSGKRLRIYIGTDATGKSLHLGHSTNYMALERFRQLGHEVIFLIGDFTSRIGDPTEKREGARKQLTREEVVENTQTWLNQVAPIIDIKNKENPVKILHNHDWLSKLTFEDVLELSAHFTVQHMLERDMFEKRLQEEKPLYLHELFYPLMQGYDSVEMEVDVEVCGSDQKFNALTGRTLLRKMKDKEKFVFITTLLENPVTKEKMMSKSLNTGVFLDFDPERMYGALMAQPDENMRQLFVDCTTLSLDEIERHMGEHTNPRDIKMKLAHVITTMYHGKDAADRAEKIFIETFQKGGTPEDVLELRPDYTEALISAGIVDSKSALTRLLKAGGVRNTETGEKLSHIPDFVEKPLTLKIGKRRFVKLVP